MLEYDLSCSHFQVNALLGVGNDILLMCELIVPSRFLLFTFFAAAATVQFHQAEIAFPIFTPI
jgi:hypothetical protein